MREYYCIGCKIERGAFTNERTFTLELSPRLTYEGGNEGRLVGTAHFEYLRDENKKPLSPDDPPYGITIEGFVLCRTIRELKDGWIVVEVPSADIIHISMDDLVPADDDV
ncbi:MAG: hypothetical protein ABR915_16340 [Thermoguttaceae bacterium]|jgi:hypothetical protein